MPKDPIFVANGLYAAGHYSSALDIWEGLLGENPASLQGLCGKAWCLAALQRYEEAKTSFLAAVSLHPYSSAPVYGYSSFLLQSGDLRGAVALYQDFLFRNPASSESLTALIQLHRRLGDRSSASRALQSLIDLKIDRADVHCDLGFLLQDEGRLEEAIASCESALRLRPDYPEAMNNMGVALERLGRFDDAFEWYSKALSLKHDFADAMSNLGAIYHLRGDFSSAAKLYWSSIAHKPFGFHAFHNLALNCIGRGEIIEALASYTRALVIDPGCLDARWSRSLCSLLLGRYLPAWNDHEVRLIRKNGAKLYATSLLPRWEDQSLVAGDRLLVISEQGLGDTIQFMRYLPFLQERGVLVEICAHPSLHGLIRSSGIHSNPLAPAQVESIKEGLWIPLLSLPMQLGVSPANSNAFTPYLYPDPTQVTQWSERMPQDGRVRVALNWQGNPESEVTNLKGRSLPLEAFAPLAERPDLTFISMQKGYGSDQLSGCSFRDRFVPCQQLVNDTWDFQETLAILANCDLLITSDTSIAHLAGAMGMPTWLLLQQVPDWRWGLDGEATFWYPSVRLFRQTERGNWDGVMDRVAKALVDLAPLHVAPVQRFVRQRRRTLAAPRGWFSSFWNWVETAGAVVPRAMSLESSSESMKNSLDKALTFSQDGSLEEARGACIDAICFGPDCIKAYHLLGAIEKRLENFERACEAFRGALCLDPFDCSSHLNLLACLCHLGEYAQAWQELERGVQFMPGSNLSVVPGGERWHCAALPAGKEVLVVCPTSITESIQWLRCLAALTEVVGQVHVCVPAPLRELVGETGLPITLCSPEQAEAFQGPWLPLLGLPGRLLLEPGSLPKFTPYLQAQPDRQQAVLSLFPSGHDPLVAIDYVLSHQSYDSLASAHRYRPFILPELVNQADSNHLSPSVGLTDLRDFAAVLANSDLVITSDGPLAHLSGALGRPTWLLLNSESDWRWGYDGERTIWYPSIRIFRWGPGQSLNAQLDVVGEALKIFRQLFSS